MLPTKYEIILKVAEMRNFTKVAEYFQYTQSAISQTIKNTEKELGITLFYRTSKNMYLSDEGEAILPALQEIVLGRRHLDETISELHQLNSGIVRFGSYNSLSIHWLPERIREFQEAYPKIQFEYYQGDDEYMLRLIDRGTVDMVLMCNPGKKDLIFRPLLDDPFVLVVPADHELAEETAVSLEELEDETFLLQELGYEPYYKELFKGCGYKPKTKFGMIDDISIISMVEQGLGISILPELMTLRLDFNVSCIPIVPYYFRHLGIVTRKSDYISWSMKKFLKFIQEDVKAP